MAFSRGMHTSIKHQCSAFVPSAHHAVAPTAVNQQGIGLSDHQLAGEEGEEGSKYKGQSFGRIASSLRFLVGSEPQLTSAYPVLTAMDAQAPPKARKPKDDVIEVSEKAADGLRVLRFQTHRPSPPPVCLHLERVARREGAGKSAERYVSRRTAAHQLSGSGHDLWQNSQKLRSHSCWRHRQG